MSTEPIRDSAWLARREWPMPTPAGTLTIARARPEDVAAAVAIEEDAAAWLRGRGIDPGQPPRPLRDIVADRIARGELYLGLRDGVAAGTLVLVAQDDGLWSDLPGEALYVHGLMVRRASAGQAVGLTMLRWAARMAHELGKQLLRLDCMGDNPALRAYYERAGFTHRGDVMLPHRLAARYEKRLHLSPGAATGARYTADIARYASVVEPFLRAHEAEHCLQLGILPTLTRDQPNGGAVGPDTPCLAWVRELGDVICVALRTPPHNVILSLVREPDRPRSCVEMLADCLYRAYDGALPGVIGPTDVALAFAEAWQRLAGGGHSLVLRERIYALDTVLPVTGVPGTLRPATEADRPLLERWIAAFAREALRGDEREQLSAAPAAWVDAVLSSSTRGLLLWEDGEPVTMVGYTSPTPRGIRVGPVYTPAERRGHGYASAATAALSQRLLDSGRQLCFLFTDLSNPTSNHIYQTIGYRPVSDVAVYSFHTEGQ